MSLSKEERFEKMKEIYEELITFKKSPLYKYRIENKFIPVIGEGSHEASIMFIGEAPGKTEAETGKPFCGRSGKILDEMLVSINMDRKDVYITNVVKDRPQENRDPTEEEIKLYTPFLDRQVDIIQPKVIATLGRFAMNYIMTHFGLQDKLGLIADMHGKELTVKASFGEVVIIPLYHPAVALYNGGTKQNLLQDFKILKKYV